MATLVETQNSGHHDDSDDEDTPASRFCGKKEDFSDWARQMGRKLYNDTVCFPTSQLQVDYVFSRLGGKAAEHFRENLPGDPGEMLHELLRFFGDPHYQRKARARFDDLAKTRQYINEPGIDFVRRLSAAARAANIILDLPAVQNRLNPTWTHALANELADDDISAQKLLDLIVKRSFVIDGVDYKRIHFSGPEGKPYVPPSLTCGHKGDSTGRCSCAAFRNSTPTIAAASKGVDWTQYPLCPSAAATQNASVEWLGDLTLVPGLKAALQKEGRCFRCRFPGAPHYFGPRNERSAWYWDKTGVRQSRGAAGSPLTPGNAALAKIEGEPRVVEIKD